MKNTKAQDYWFFFFRSVFYFKIRPFQREEKGWKVTLNCFSNGMIDLSPERGSKFLWDLQGRGVNPWCSRMYSGRRKSLRSVEQSDLGAVSCCWLVCEQAHLCPILTFLLLHRPKVDPEKLSQDDHLCQKCLKLECFEFRVIIGFLKCLHEV